MLQMFEIKASFDIFEHVQVQYTCRYSNVHEIFYCLTIQVKNSHV